jgi:hypothetical protein
MARPHATWLSRQPSALNCSIINMNLVCDSQARCCRVLAVPGAPSAVAIITATHVHVRDFATRAWHAGATGCWDVLLPHAEAALATRPDTDDDGATAATLQPTPPSFAHLDRSGDVRCYTCCRLPCC